MKMRSDSPRKGGRNRGKAQKRKGENPDKRPSLPPIRYEESFAIHDGKTFFSIKKTSLCLCVLYRFALEGNWAGECRALTEKMCFLLWGMSCGLRTDEFLESLPQGTPSVCLWQTAPSRGSLIVYVSSINQCL